MISRDGQDMGRDRDLASISAQSANVLEEKKGYHGVCIITVVRLLLTLALKGSTQRKVRKSRN